MNKKLTALFMIALIVLMSIGLAGCGKEDGVSIDDVEMGGNGDAVIVQQYFVSSEYIVMGSDEENGELMPPVEKKITVKDEENKFLLAVESLKTTPDGDNSYSTAVSDRYKINDISAEDGIAYVDFSSDGLEGGSLDEMLVIDQIVYTLSNSFEEVAAVKFTVDGEEAETLMGSVDISNTFVADYLE